MAILYRCDDHWLVVGTLDPVGPNPQFDMSLNITACAKIFIELTYRLVFTS